MEYSAGTIRVVLARGVGRVQLLAAKLLALGIFALVVIAGSLVLAVPFGLALVAAQHGSLPHLLPVLADSERYDLWVHLLTVLVSSGVCILIGATGAATTRSLPLAMVIAVMFFPLDNLIAGDRDYNVYQLVPAGPELERPERDDGPHAGERLHPAGGACRHHARPGRDRRLLHGVPAGRVPFDLASGRLGVASMPQPSFSCLVSGELRKVVRQRSNWVVPLAAVGVGVAAGATAADQANLLHEKSFAFGIDVYRVFAAASIGVLMLALSARLVAMEYQLGTVRAILARGVGRPRLLLAKLAALGLVALSGLAALMVAGIVFVAIQIHQRPTAAAWREVWIGALTVLLSTGACGLLGAAAGAVGRSMTFAAAVAVGLFPVDNILGYLLPILGNATQERVWSELTTYQLGLALNHLPLVLMGRRAGELVAPALPVDATHTLLVIAVYVAVFVAGGALLSWRRDTLE
jgi:ABC-2 type transport system permease protein